jgi:hypothetical protein
MPRACRLFCAVKLLFIYGRPAVGKLTVARAVAARTGGRLFHNHLTVNLVLSVFDFGTPGFIELRERIWMDVFRRALAEKVPLLIFTFNPEDSVPQRFIDGLFSEIADEGGKIIPVELTASEPEIEARLGNESRRLDRKTLDTATYRELRAKGAFDSPVIPEPRLRLDTGRLSAAEAAEQIAEILKCD